MGKVKEYFADKELSSDEYMSEPEITSVKPNYKRKRLIKYLEKNFDKWSKSEDWWGGTNTWDVNVFKIYPHESGIDYDSYIYTISVYGLEVYDRTLQVNTSDELDHLELYL